MRALVSLALLLSAAVLATPVYADGLRCNGRVLREGDPRSMVRSFCGEPSDVQTRTILRRPYYNFRGRTVYAGGDDLVEIPVETWTYNFGPNKLMRRIRFIDGQIDDIETLGYGYHEPARGTYDARGYNER